MNKRDMENLQFILNTYREGEQAVREWMDTVEAEDLSYALELINRYRENKEHFDTIINSYFE